MTMETIGFIKKAIWIAIVLALFKIYENKGFVNPITISVLLIVFCLWILFRLELNEQVEFEELENRNNAAPPTPPSTTTDNNTTTANGQTNNIKEVKPECETERIIKKVKRSLTKFQRLARSRSRSVSKSRKE